jgi:hypothetical protein
MKKKDNILVAFSGRPDGYIQLIDWRKPAGQVHRDLRPAGSFTPISFSLGDIRDLATHPDTPPAEAFTDAQCDDSLKVSGCINLTAYAGYVKGGREDVMDVNHSVDCFLHLSVAEPKGKYVTTQKGGSQGLKVFISKQVGHGSEVDHDYGNHSDQGNGYTKDCELTVSEVTQGNATVRVLRGTMPQLHSGPFKVVFPKPNSWYHSIVIWFLNRFQ